MKEDAKVKSHRYHTKGGGEHVVPQTSERSQETKKSRKEMNNSKGLCRISTFQASFNTQKRSQVINSLVRKVKD